MSLTECVHLSGEASATRAAKDEDVVAQLPIKGLSRDRQLHRLEVGEEGVVEYSGEAPNCPPATRPTTASKNERMLAGTCAPASPSHLPRRISRRPFEAEGTTITTTPTS